MTVVPTCMISSITAALRSAASRAPSSAASGTPLSFVLIIGATAPALALPCIATLATSPFYRGRLVVGVSEHVYVCGRQFMKPDAATFRACDTGCFFLQSAAAAKAWPVTDAKLAKLRAAFEATNANRS